MNTGSCYDILIVKEGNAGAGIFGSNSRRILASYETISTVVDTEIYAIEIPTLENLNMSCPKGNRIYIRPIGQTAINSLTLSVWCINFNKV